MIREFQGENRWLSNFATAEVEFDGKLYPSVEHAWVAAKKIDNEWREKCSNPNLHPAQIKKMGDEVTLREDWGVVNESIMKELLFSKFSKEPFKSKLIASGNTYIMEGNWWGDKYWGVCLKTNLGRNLLGELIMEVRYELIKREHS